MFWCCCEPEPARCGTNATEYFAELPIFGIVGSEIEPLWLYVAETNLITSNYPNIAAINGNLGYGNALVGSLQFPGQVRFCIRYPAIIAAGYGWQVDVQFNSFFDPAECPWDDWDFGWTNATGIRNKTYFEYDLEDAATGALNHSYRIARVPFSNEWEQSDETAWNYEPIGFRSTLECQTFNPTSGLWNATLRTFVDDVLWKTQSVLVRPDGEAYIRLRGFFKASLSYDHLNYYPGSDDLKWQIDSFIFSYTD